MQTTQIKFDFPLSEEVERAVEAISTQSQNEERGAIFTKREVVDLILNLTGYTTEKELFRYKILEPSCGKGDFLLPIAKRLVSSWKKANGIKLGVGVLKNAILGVEIHKESYNSAKSLLIDMLISEGIGMKDAKELSGAWLRQDDFLLTKIEGEFDFIVGNPPYLRQEMIPEPLLREYRERYSTMFDRADIYIPFIERSLTLLNANGRLGFICADRWMKNRYGGPLREMVAKDFSLEIYIDMSDCPAFHTDVIAYPAITIIGRGKSGETRIAKKPEINQEALERLFKNMSDKEPKGSGIKVVEGIVKRDEPWILETSEQTEAIRKIESRFPTIEESKCRIGIGVATGADEAFIGEYASMDIEESRKLRLVTTRDIVSGEVQWKGKGVLNPFEKDGALVNPNKYPKFKRYIEDRKHAIKKRHCAQKDKEKWFRTIDPIHTELTKKEKLLIPDIKGDAHIVYENEGLYPHHNLYYVTSEEWDIRALQAVLLSSVTKHFIATYSTKMRGGFLRFQAQYLRRIRLPSWNLVSKEIKDELRKAGLKRDVNACNLAAYKLYCLTPKEREAFRGNGD